MEILEATEACFVVDDDLLDFTLLGEAEEDEDPKTIFKGASPSSSSSSLTTAAAAAAAEFRHETRTGSFPVSFIPCFLCCSMYKALKLKPQLQIWGFPVLCPLNRCGSVGF